MRHAEGLLGVQTAVCACAPVLQTAACVHVHQCACVRVCVRAWRCADRLDSCSWGHVLCNHAWYVNIGCSRTAMRPVLHSPLMPCCYPAVLQLLCCPMEAAASADADWQLLQCGQPASGYKVSDGKVTLGAIKDLQGMLQKSPSLNVVVKVMAAEFGQVRGPGGGLVLRSLGCGWLYELSIVCLARRHPAFDTWYLGSIAFRSMVVFGVCLSTRHYDTCHMSTQPACAATITASAMRGAATVHTPGASAALGRIAQQLLLPGAPTTACLNQAPAIAPLLTGVRQVLDPWCPPPTAAGAGPGAALLRRPAGEDGHQGREAGAAGTRACSGAAAAAAAALACQGAVKPSWRGEACGATAWQLQSAEPAGG